MAKDFAQIEWDSNVEADCRRIVHLALDEDLLSIGDRTTDAIVSPSAIGRAAIVARKAGIIAGLPAGQLAVGQFDPAIQWQAAVVDGATIEAGTHLATIAGPARSLLTIERTLLNLLGRLSGIATLTRQYVDAVAGTRARIYDTRKTTPGWRRLEKYAVRQGGGWNHRRGLFDAILIKDNHLAVAAAGSHLSPAEAVRLARKLTEDAGRGGGTPILEVEVDTLEQLREVLTAGPDIVLLDNMSPKSLCEAVALRSSLAPEIELEASGGITLSNIGEIARTGVERISVGALTHSAVSLDIGLDWE